MTTSSARPWTYALIAALAVYAFGRCDGKHAADLGWHERNVAKVTAHVRVQRKALAAAIAAKDASSRRVGWQSAALDTAQTDLRAQLDSTHDALRDETASNATLRARLGALAQHAERVDFRADSLQSAIVRDAQAHLAERAANKSVIAAQDAVIQAQKRQIKALTPTLFRRIVQTTCTAGLAAGGAALGTLVPAPAAPIIGATLGVGLSAMVCQ